MEIKSGQTYLVNTGYKLYSSATDDEVNEEKDGNPFEFMLVFGPDSDNGGTELINTLTSLAATISLIMF